MSYAEAHRSEKNRHEFPREPLIGAATICSGSCQRCGDQFDSGGKWVSVGEWITRLREGYGGCVALPAPAVSAPERDNLPRVSERRHDERATRLYH